MYKLNKISREWLLLIIIAIIVVTIGIFEWNKNKTLDTSDGGEATTSTPPRWSNQNNDGGGISKEEGDVTVMVEYLPRRQAGLAEQSNNSNMVFQIALDTHSVNLDVFDFQKDVKLEKDNKESYPTSINQSGSDHHRKAEVTFSRVMAPLTIVVINVSNISRREFKFTTL